jgi:UDP-N-acetylmuramoylalanine--D-glutamate ligase
MRLMSADAYFKGKKITVMGLGLLGGVGDIAYLAEQGAEVIATDLKSEEELEPSLAILRKYPNISYTLGKHELADFQNRDLIIKAPSTPVDSPYIMEARKNGIEVTMWAALFARFAREAGATIVGITGTRGKTTVTAMITAGVRAAGMQVVEGGNVRGTSVLPQLATVSIGTIAVLELDSWKLQGFGEANMSPHIAVFTSFYPDHMNYYKGDMDAYLADKANIFLYQTEEDTLILGKQCAPTIIEKYGEAIQAHTIVADEMKLPETWKLSVPGVHNRYNAALALATLRTLGIEDEVTREALTTFPGVPGRLELVREVNGIKVYNDTTATTPEATLVALRALDGGSRNVILIMGGADKELDMNKLLHEIPNFTKRVIMLTGTGTNRVLEFLPGASVFDDLSKAVHEAFSAAESGDIILFSPAFASFGMFKNEYDRGDQFNAMIQAYGK